jgi:signal transduction histidine kinase
METRGPVEVHPGPDAEVDADPDQVELILINLVKNAVEASRESGKAVVVGWTAIARPAAVELWVDDEGPGPPDTGNLFVPFFTTKPKGSGIGLVLSRQIAEAHGGSLTLAAHPRGHGSRAALRLPRPRAVSRPGGR